MSQKHNGHAQYIAYATGFALSLILTLSAYVVVVNDVFAGSKRLAAVLVVAIAQLGVQLYFFLHLGSEERPRWQQRALIFTLLIIVMFVLGTLWIMDNLDYHGTMPREQEQHILHDEGIAP